MKENNKKKERGITLIALVITIIVLLILAGVSISMLTGENGILTQAQKAKNETENAARQEEMDLAEIEAAITGKDVPIIQVDDKNPGQLEQENDTTFVINSIEDLVFFSHDVTNGTTYEGKTVKLGTNLDFNSDKSYVDPNRTDFVQYGYNGPLKQALTSGTGFSPIGELSKAGTKYFYGTFDGNKKVICSLYINIDLDEEADDEEVGVGLFTTNYGEIKNLGLLNINMMVDNLVNVDVDVGGLVADSYNNIYNSYVTGNIKGTISSWITVGGICGAQREEESSIENCYNLANIQFQRINDKDDESIGGSLGGIVGGGININKCYNAGNIIFDAGNNGFGVGGICGSSTLKGGTIKNCYNLAKIEGRTKATKREVYIGGIVGASQSSNVLCCYNSGNIVGKGTNLMIAGIVARQSKNDITISNVFNMGKIDIEDDECYFAGGIIGYVVGNGAYHGNINNTYNIGKISIETPKSNIGSIAGSNWGNRMTFDNCYYLTVTYDVSVGSQDRL